MLVMRGLLFVSKPSVVPLKFCTKTRHIIALFPRDFNHRELKAPAIGTFETYCGRRHFLYIRASELLFKAMLVVASDCMRIDGADRSRRTYEHEMGREKHD